MAVEILEIAKVLSFNDFLNEIKEYSKISDDSGIRYSSGINHGYGINNGSGINYGYGIENSYGIYKCKYIKNCKGLSVSVMCLNTSGQNRVFNKKVGKSRFEEINKKIEELRDGWYPRFTNTFDLREENGGLWENVPAPKISDISNIEAYKDMPKELIEYFKSLPEFDSEIFKEITGIEV